MNMLARDRCLWALLFFSCVCVLILSDRDLQELQVMRKANGKHDWN